MSNSSSNIDNNTNNEVTTDKNLTSSTNILESSSITPSSSTNLTQSNESEPLQKATRKTNPRQKRTALACIRCRTRHIRCPGGDPCKKCQLAKSKCEYVEADKKIVVSMKYLSKLHDDIARLKKDNAMLRNNLKESEDRNEKNQYESTILSPRKASFIPPVTNQFNTNSSNQGGEVINPSLDKYGRLIQSRTGEKVYVGSSSMTLFGLEIQNMVPSFVSSSLLPNSTSTTPISSPGSFNETTTTSPKAESMSSTSSRKRETKILEKEGNAYKITLSKTNTRPGLSINFSLPSYSYAMLLADTFINYNDGCFYFFNEGLIKRYLLNLYSGKNEENKKILRRNISLNTRPDQDQNSIKKDQDDETILESIWFCKILFIFAIGEMYLGTESSTHVKNIKLENMKRKEKRERHTLPGSGFFYQASELFTGLFASGAIDNITKDGGIEVMLLYAFYLQVADCTIASYFYFGLALRAALILGWHVDADNENLNRFELEHRRRIWWTVYMYERMLSSKAGLPLSFADDSVSTELPVDFKIDLSDFPRDESDVRGYYIFPPADYINNCVTITQINAVILSSLYTKQPTFNILPVVSDLVTRLMSWKTSLPKYLDIDFSEENPKVSRLIVNLMTEYFQGVNLAVRPLLFHFASRKFKELKIYNSQNKYIDLTKYSKNVLTLLNASFQASINTIKSIWSLVPDNMVALFGWMDREYLFTSASTLILFNASFGVHEATKIHLDHALTLFTKMKRLGNYPAALKRAQLIKLIRVLDFNGVMVDILEKHDEDYNKVNKDKPETKEVIHDLTTAGQSVVDFMQFNTNTKSGDVYSNQDLTGIEGLTYLDEEQKLWNEITNEAGWLNVHQPDQPSQFANKTQPDENSFMFNVISPDINTQFNSCGYSELINQEFQDFMDQT
ncbi:unnamed protein product [Candida verbasci]|uniref:Zn(2)-C6 fungal-type domain-containing protein n=1 Tax=Candida verbasci TaxID=1227364 RepID=A0A9W4TX48_9ASCO|nr:unnamed protein product [Candida verbasci]